MRERKSGGVGVVIRSLLFLAVLGWIAAVVSLSHMNMTNQQALGHRAAMFQTMDELGLHLPNLNRILVPKFDGSLDIFIDRPALESIPYPDRDEFATALADIWCDQVSPFLLPAVHLRDVQTGSTLVTRGCAFQSSPDITGNYSGTVHNNAANIDSTFEVQLVKDADRFKGCIQVALPLVGTGLLNGTSNGRSFVFDLSAPDIRIRFEGTRVGHSITGRYTVTTTGETGGFTLHQDISRVNIGFDPSKCPPSIRLVP